MMMHFKLGALAAAFVSISNATSLRASHAKKTNTQEKVSRELTVACSSYDQGIASRTITQLWANAADGDTEWLNKNNYNYKHWPGLAKFNKVIMAANDVGTVNCDVVPNNNVYLEMRSGSTLDVSANLNIADQLIMKTNAVLTQTSSSIINVGKNLYLAAKYSISDMAKLSIGLDLHMASNAQLTIVGGGTSIAASDVTPTDSQIHGVINFSLGASGTGVFDLGGKLTIGPTTAKINIDASAYTGGANSIPLIKYTSVVGAYSPANIVITGLSSGLDWSVVSKADGLYLKLTGEGGPPPTTTTEATTTTQIITTLEPETTTSSTTPQASTTSITTVITTTEKATTTSTSTTTPEVTTTEVPPSTTEEATTSTSTTKPEVTTTEAPQTTTTTEAPPETTTQSPQTTTDATETITTSSTTTTPEFWTTTESPPTTTEAPDSSTTTIALLKNGFVPIVSDGTCPPQEITTILIDGAAYTGGPGTVTLYECSDVDATYDLMNIRLVNFPEGLWFEWAYHNDSIDLIIKSLANYKDYSQSYRDSYPDEEYPEQVHTDHFPDHSFDTVPTWTRFSKKLHLPGKINRGKPDNFNAGPWSEEDIDLIAKKHYLSWYGLNSADHITEIWDRIKDADPTHKTMYYWNAETLWGTTDQGTGAQPDYFRSDVVGTNDRPLFDHSNTEMRDWWVKFGLTMANHPSSNGVFTDNTISRECDRKKSDWENGNAAACDLETTDKSVMVRDLAQAVPDDRLDIGNYLRNMVDGGNRFRMKDADGTYFENTHFSPDTGNKLEPIIVSMQLAREASWKKKLVMWTGSRRNCRCGFNNIVPKCNQQFCTAIGQTCCVPQMCQGFVQTNGVEPTALLENDFEIALAEFLMVVEKWSYGYFAVAPDWTCEKWRADWSHMELFNKPLGKPLGPPLKSGYTFSRHFEHLSVKIKLKWKDRKSVV